VNKGADTRPTLIRGARLIDPGAKMDAVRDVLIDGMVEIDPATVPDDARVVDARGLWLLPGLVDIQVHFRQPGNDHKETIATGSSAAFAGGVTSVVVMPNTSPPLDTAERVRFQMEEARRVDGVGLLVAACATQDMKGKAITDHGALKEAGAVAITDDGLPVLDDDVMRASLQACAKEDLLFMQHAEDTRVTQHAPLTAGPVAEALGVPGQSADAEGVIVERDIALAAETGARYHVLHTSTARSLRAVREAKSAGHRVTCEASPHHLLLTDEAAAGGDTNFKMNPPLRSAADRDALVAALVDGTVDAVATDHAPHHPDEKARGMVDAPFGVVGLETAFPALLELVEKGVIDAVRAVELMTSGPARVLGLAHTLGTLSGPNPALDFCLVDPNGSWTVHADDLAGQSVNSAFLGHTFPGRVVATWKDGTLRFCLDEEKFGPAFPPHVSDRAAE
jgi:dihydroorotase